MAKRQPKVTSTHAVQPIKPIPPQAPQKAKPSLLRRLALIGCISTLALCSICVVGVALAPKTPTPVPAAKGPTNATNSTVDNVALGVQSGGSTVTDVATDTATNTSTATNIATKQGARILITFTPGGKPTVKIVIVTNTPKPPVLFTPKPTAKPATAKPAKVIVPTQASNAAVCPNLHATCGNLSCGEAYACLKAGNHSLDKDGDGVPCESICPGG